MKKSDVIANYFDRLSSLYILNQPIRKPASIFNPFLLSFSSSHNTLYCTRHIQSDLLFLFIIVNLFYLYIYLRKSIKKMLLYIYFVCVVIKIIYFTTCTFSFLDIYLRLVSRSKHFVVTQCYLFLISKKLL